MASAQQGDTVQVHYTGRLDDGTIFDSSIEREPIEFTIGQRQLIPGFERAVVGLSPGDSTEVTIESEEAYGPYREEMVVEVGKDQLPPDLPASVGQQLEMRQPNGESIAVRISNVSDASVTLDANHPLAGKDLTFDLQLVAIV